MQNPDQYSPEEWFKVAREFGAKRQPAEVRPASTSAGSLDYIEQLARGGALRVEHLIHKGEPDGVHSTYQTVLRLVQDKGEGRYGDKEAELDVEKGADGQYELRLSFKDKGQLEHRMTVGGEWVIPAHLAGTADNLPVEAPVAVLESLKRTLELNIEPNANAAYVDPAKEAEKKQDFTELFGFAPEKITAAQLLAKLKELWESLKKNTDEAYYVESHMFSYDDAEERLNRSLAGMRRDIPRMEYALELAQPYVQEDLKDLRWTDRSGNVENRKAILGGKLTLKRPTGLRDRLGF